nr:MAG TPA_asm: hypothetical protein [Caudoviricetes sp.]
MFQNAGPGQGASRNAPGAYNPPLPKNSILAGVKNRETQAQQALRVKRRRAF